MLTACISTTLPGMLLASSALTTAMVVSTSDSIQESLDAAKTPVSFVSRVDNQAAVSGEFLVSRAARLFTELPPLAADINAVQITDEAQIPPLLDQYLARIIQCYAGFVRHADQVQSMLLRAFRDGCLDEAQALQCIDEFEDGILAMAKDFRGVRYLAKVADSMAQRQGLTPALGKIAGILHDTNHTLTTLNMYLDSLQESLRGVKVDMAVYSQILSQPEAAFIGLADVNRQGLQRAINDMLYVLDNELDVSTSSDTELVVLFFNGLNALVEDIHSLLLELTNDLSSLLDISSPQRHPEKIDLRLYVTKRLLRRDMDATERRDVRLNVVNAVDSLSVMGYRRDIQRIVSNMVRNSIEAMYHSRSKEISVILDRVSLMSEDLTSFEVNYHGYPPMAGSDYVRLRFIDNGSGISPLQQPHIFERHYSTKQGDSLRGEGLANVLGAVIAMNGFICVESQLGRGTQFSLYFPLV